LPDRPARSKGQTPGGDARGFSFALLNDPEQGLQLLAKHRPAFGPIRVDWMLPEVQRRVVAGRRQPLARAAGLHKPGKTAEGPSLLDATAGLGRDGYVLAALGARVSLAERHPSVVALLEDALQRIRRVPGQAEVAGRLEVVGVDAIPLLASGRRWDLIYLDPMYPEDGKTALPGKEMQILRELTGGDADADSLLAPAIACARSRVIVKRPLNAPWLAGLRPSMHIASTQLRFDVYVAPSAASTDRLAP